MLDRSELWRSIAASDSFRLETVAEIGGVTYERITSPVITRALMTDALSVGNCISATLQLSILPEGTIPKSAAVKIRHRLSNGGQTSEWLPAGTFFISQRREDPVSGFLTLTCYDAMLKVNADYPIDDETAWPKSMEDCVREIAALLGVEVDSRTWSRFETGFQYVVSVPTNLTIGKVLGYIAGANGGNWCITKENKLRFVPLLSSVDTENTLDSNRVNVLGIGGSISVGNALTVSRISASNGTEIFTFGDNTGAAVTVARNPCITKYIAEDLYGKLNGLTYQPFTLDKAVFDPAAELGDYVFSRDDVRSVLYTETANCNLAFRGGMSAPFKSEVESEYPHIGTAAQVEDLTDQVSRIQSLMADKADISDLTALTAMVQNLTVEDLKADLIHSNDYEVEEVPYIYPSDTLYPADTLYPSAGNVVLRGFAIDFKHSVILGAFYSEQISALQDAITNWKEQIETVTQQIADFNTRMNAVEQKDDDQDSAIQYLFDELTVCETALNGCQSDIETLKTDVSGLLAAVEKQKTALVYPRSPVTS